jgi:hypothetical protein
MCRLSLEHRTGALGRLIAVLLVLQIQAEIFNAGSGLIRLVQGFDVDGTNTACTVRHQILDEMAADKSSRTANDTFRPLIFIETPLPRP